MELKVCSKCNIIKEVKFFSKHKLGKNGIRPYCKKCASDFGKTESSRKTREVYRNRPENKLKKLLRNRLPENRLKEKLYKASESYKAKSKHRSQSPEYKLKRSSYKKNNKGKVNAHTALRYARKKARTPKWLSKLHLKEISAFYEKAFELSQNSGKVYHVDHIIPMCGVRDRVEFVCGLHVPWNMQIIESIDNLKKSNKV